MYKNKVLYLCYEKCISGGGTYTAFYNFLNYPAGSLPVTKITAQDNKEMEESYPTNTHFYKGIKKVP